MNKWINRILVAAGVLIVFYALHRDITNANREIKDRIREQVQDDVHGLSKHDIAMEQQLEMLRKHDVAMRHQVDYLMKFAVTRPATRPGN